MASKLTRVGAILTALGIIGFFTVADDWRHTGELAGVGSLLAAGLILLVVALASRQKN